jgi:PAS domain S-box-containing protein
VQRKGTEMSEERLAHTILVVEDDEALSYFIKMKLQRLKFAVETTFNGCEAIDFLAKNSTRDLLMLLDYQLGDMTAGELVAHLSEKGIAVPFIVMTGYGTEQIAVDMMRLGATDYIVKDTAFVNLLDSVVLRAVDEITTLKELEKTEQALRTEQTHLLNNIPDMVFQVDNEYNFTSLNPAVKDILGYTKEELLGQSLFGFLHPGEADSVRAEYAGAAKGLEIQRRPVRFIRRDSSVCWLEGNIVPIFDKAGNPIGVSAIYKDITPEKVANDELKEANQRITLLLDNSPNIILETDTGQKLVSLNETARRFFADDGENIKGRYCAELFPQKWRKSIRQALRLSAAGDSVKLTVQAVAPDSKLRWFDVIFSPITDATGRIARLLGTLWDVSERVTREQKVLDLQKRMDSSLEHADRLLKAGHVASQIAHEIANPLTFISSQIQRMVAEDAPPDAVRLQKLLGHVDRISGLIGRLSDLGRQNPLSIAPTPLKLVIENAVDLVAGSDLFRKISIEQSIQADLPPVRIDRDKITQVFLNLLLNAADACAGHGRIRVTAAVKTVSLQSGTERTAARYITVAFADSGTGITPKNLQHIFEPFFTTKPAGKGTGLGLSVSLSIVHMHHGWIDVDSKPGKGATFTIYLPIEAAKLSLPHSAARFRTHGENLKIETIK